jgi:hypothetical protein
MTGSFILHVDEFVLKICSDRNFFVDYCRLVEMVLFRYIGTYLALVGQARRIRYLTIRDWMYFVVVEGNARLKNALRAGHYEHHAFLVGLWKALLRLLCFRHLDMLWNCMYTYKPNILMCKVPVHINSVCVCQSYLLCHTEVVAYRD